jgi:glutamyl-Q tRNA(Asp) synthetase
MSVPYRGRFAPTPSGPLHFGSLVSAAGSFREARSRGGCWHLRIDDLDAPRVAPGATDAILRCLERCGLHWDGPVVFQSAHISAYHAALHDLRQRRAVFACACSRTEIEAAGLRGTAGPVYPGTCRDGLPVGRRARAWRLRVDHAGLDLHDDVLGPQHIDLNAQGGDFVLYRADGVYSFHLASAVDELELGITDVVRGSDLLESSARQIHLLRMLGRTPPRYMHLPVAVDASGVKLSKQTGAQPVDDTQPVRTLCEVLRFLGQPVPQDSEMASLENFWRYAIANWDLRRVAARLSAPAP